MKADYVELLAPAGSLVGLKAVIAAGADAVYIGGQRFGARAYADNPDEKELSEAIDYAHLRGVKVYLTVNTLLKDGEIAELVDYIRPYYEQGLDAVLVQDMGVLRILRQHFPDLPLHASTQMTVTGSDSARFLKKQGVTRVVPAREMTIEELGRIHDDSGLEVEAFVHGALCYCYSGQCLMSSLIGGRSGNRGRCAQPCRLPYKSGKRQGTLLSLKDLCTIDHLPELIEAGVVSYKIEGRMKQPAYAAGVVSVYRRYLDLALCGKPYCVSEEDRRLLNDLYNRQGFTDGYLTSHNGRHMMAVAEKNGSAGHSDAVYEKMNAAYVKNEMLIPVEGFVSAFVGSPLCFTVTCGDYTVTVCDETDVEMASKQPVTAEALRQRFMKTGGTDFCFSHLEVETDKAFIPVSTINRVRREGLEQLKQAMVSKYHRVFDKGAVANSRGMTDATLNEAAFLSRILSASVETDAQYDTLLGVSSVKRVYYPLSLLFRDASPYEKARRVIDEASKVGKALYIALPFIEREKKGAFSPMYSETFEKDLIAMGCRGLLVRSLESLGRLERQGLASYTQLDASVYAFNKDAVAFYRENGFKNLTVPYELSKKEIRQLAPQGEEMVVYGCIPAMVTANCIRKTADSCTGKAGLTSLEDRTKRSFAVNCDCVFCYNVIYNSVPLSLLGDLDFVSRIGITSARLSFTTESRAEVEAVCRDFTAGWLDGKAVSDTRNHTRGHFVRGVE